MFLSKQKIKKCICIVKELKTILLTFSSKQEWNEEKTQNIIKGMLKFCLTPNPPRKKRIKEPGEPKGIRNSYIFFSMEKRPLFKIKYPELKGVFVLIKLGKKWRKLDDDEKIPYKQLFEKDKIRYIKEKEIFISSKSSKSEEEEKQFINKNKNKKCLR